MNPRYVDLDPLVDDLEVDLRGIGALQDALLPRKKTSQDWSKFSCRGVGHQ